MHAEIVTQSSSLKALQELFETMQAEKKTTAEVDTRVVLNMATRGCPCYAMELCQTVCMHGPGPFGLFLHTVPAHLLLLVPVCMCIRS